MARWLAVAVLVLLLLTSGVGIYNVVKPLPEGLEFDGPARPAWGLRLLTDMTYIDAAGERRSRQEIFDEAFSIIRGARRFVLLDMFLYNDFQGSPPETTRALSGELTEELIRHRALHPAARVILVTDPINDVYGGMPSAQFGRLRDAGVEVVVTDIDKLRDSNPLYSGPWRVFLKRFGNSAGQTVPNPFGSGKVTVRSYLRLLNFKANHRKVLVADNGGEGLVGMVMSANPHDGSSAHSNVALRFEGPAVADLLETERAVIAFSGGLDIKPVTSNAPPKESSGVTIKVVTERAIKNALLGSIARAARGDSLTLAMFYLSDRDVVLALKGASKRGAWVRVVLDPNKDAFGIKRNGVPNRQVARELRDAGVQMRWCDTHGEQCHFKMLHAEYAGGGSALIIGSANFTRRNLESLNLETNVVAEGPSGAPVFIQAREHFDLLWHNAPGMALTAKYEKYSDDSALKVLLYRFMEAFGVSTF